MTEPEIAAAQTALAAVPSGWRSPEFEATVLRRAELQAAARKLAARVAEATAGVAAVLEAISTGDVADATITALVEGRAVLVGLQEAQPLLPAPSIDVGVCGRVLDLAGGAVQQCAPVAPRRPAYVAQMDAWRAFCLTRVGQISPVDPPVASDADRVAEVSWRDAQTRVETWRFGAAAWQSDRAGNADVLAMLGAAVSYVALAAELVPVVEAANAVTLGADGARRKAGLSWSVPA